MGVDRGKVDDALDVTELSESDVYEAEELREEIEELEDRIEELTEFKSGPTHSMLRSTEPVAPSSYRMW